MRTVGDLAETPLDTLRHAIGEAGALRLHELAWGRDPRAVSPGRDEKSIGHEVTFETDKTDSRELHRDLLRLSDAVGARLRRAEVTARTVVLKLRFEDFTTITRSRTLADPDRPRPPHLRGGRATSTTRRTRRPGRCGSSACAASS